eukprot:Partr_v1_DN24428_c0_g1_i1_m66255 putative phosphoribosyltransferase
MKNVIEIPDVSSSYAIDHFALPHHYADDLECVLIPHGLILNRVEKLAQLIVQDYESRNDSTNRGLVVVCILKGGHQFFADLLNAIKRINQNGSRSVPMALEFIKIRSYENDASTGTVSIELTGNETWVDIGKRFKNRDILIVEDIIDTGRTMAALLEKLKTIDAAKVSVSSLFVKRCDRSNGYQPDYAGFSIPDKFIVGYGLDYNEFFRDLDHVCVINDHGRKKYSV